MRAHQYQGESTRPGPGSGSGGTCPDDSGWGFDPDDSEDSGWGFGSDDSGWGFRGSR